MVEKLEHHGLVLLLENGFKILMVVIHEYKGTNYFILFNFNKSAHSKLQIQHIGTFEILKNL